MSVINTNYLALVSQNNLSKSQGALGTAIERLSSGLRINSAKDDAAGQAIANRFTSNIKGLTQASRNANDGISIAQTAEGALNQINDNLQRVRELTVQAQNGTNSASDIDSIQQEVNQRLEEINRIAEETDFNGTKILDVGVGGKTISIQVGAEDNQTIDIKIGNQNDWNKFGGASTTYNRPEWGSETRKVQAQGFDVLEQASGVAVSLADVDAAFTVAGGASASTEAMFTYVNSVYDTAHSGDVAELVSYTNDAGQESYALRSNGTDATSSSVVYAVTFDKDGVPTIGNELTGGSAALALTSTNVINDTDNITPASGSSALQSIDDALMAVDKQRSQLGAIQNRFQSTIENLNNTVNNLSAARSRIEDADYATEVSNMTRAQILQQAGTSVLAQANQIPQGVLSLLR